MRTETNATGKTFPYFNHLSPDLTPNDRSLLLDCYRYYHRTQYAYRKTRNNFRYKKIAIDVTLGLISLGTVGVSVGVNPFVAIATGVSVIVTKVAEELSLKRKIHAIDRILKFIQPILDKLKSHLRGVKFERNQLLAELQSADQLITAQNVLVKNKYLLKYDKFHKLPVEPALPVPV